jgi:hypothetical protein
MSNFEKYPTERIWYTPDKYIDKYKNENEHTFKLRTGIEWYIQGRYDKSEFFNEDGTLHQLVYYDGMSEISKEEYDEHWVKYYIIKAIKNLD